jgi:hypothetical protein
MNNSTAFKGTALEVINLEVRTPRGSVHTVRGCRCRRSKCQKKYCECFSAGLQCTHNCVCVDCANGNTLSSPAEDRGAADSSAYEESYELADKKPSRGAPAVASKPPKGGLPQAASTRRQKDDPAANAKWPVKYEDNAMYPMPDAGVAAPAASAYFHPNGHGGQGSATAGLDPALQALHSRPPLGGVSAPVAAGLKQPASGGTSSRRKPSISVQVPVAAFSKGSVIPLSEPDSGSGSARPGDSSGPGSAAVYSDGGQLLPTPSLQALPSGITLQTPKSGPDFSSLLSGNSFGGLPRSVSDNFSFSWPPPQAEGGGGGGVGMGLSTPSLFSPATFGSGLTPLLGGGSAALQASDGWSPREGRSSGRRSATSATGGRLTWGQGSAGGGGGGGFGFAGSAGGNGAGGAGGTRGGGARDGFGGDDGAGGGGGGGGTPLGGGNSPAPYTRSRSSNLASALLHSSTPPTSPSTWANDPLLAGDPLQDPDAILAAPLSGRAWVHRDLA